MDQSIWQETFRKEAYKENLGSRNKHEGRVCAEKRESVSVVKGTKRGGAQVYTRTIKEMVH